MLVFSHGRPHGFNTAKATKSMNWLTWFASINLIDGLNYYLILCFLVSTVLRVRTYRAVLGLVLTGAQRWPKLLALAKTHRTVFLGWPLLLTIGLSFLILLANVLASRLLLAHARVTAEDLREHLLAFGIVLLSGGMMVFVDGKSIFGGSRFDRVAIECDLDKAESWLTSWVSPALRLLTFGFVNPRKIVGTEVHRLLVEANWIMIGGMWWSSLRIGVQFVFSLCLWLTWALLLRPAG